MNTERVRDRVQINARVPAHLIEHIESERRRLGMRSRNEVLVDMIERAFASWERSRERKSLGKWGGR